MLLKLSTQEMVNQVYNFPKSLCKIWEVNECDCKLLIIGAQQQYCESLPKLTRFDWSEGASANPILIGSRHIVSSWLMEIGA